MSFFKIRSSRITVEIPVNIFLQERESGILSQVFIPGFLVNVSKTGACIVVSRVMLNGDHIFFTTQDRKQHYLYMPDVFVGDQKKYDLLGVSIWMDGCTFKDKPSFKIGMKLFQHKEKLYTLLKKTR